MTAGVNSVTSPTTTSPKEDVWDGEVYKKTANLQQQLGLQVIHSHTDMKNTKIILDVGCGDGFLTRYLAQHFPASQVVVGIDSSDSMIRTATESTKDPKIQIKKFDITDPGITSLIQFDTIFSFNALHWVNSQQAALRNIYRLLSFGGTFRAQLFPPLASQRILIDNIEKLMQEEPWQSHLKDFKLPVQMEIFTAEEYGTILKDVGFTVHQSAEITYTFTQTREEIANGLKSWLPHLRMIPPVLHDQFLKLLVDLIFIEKGAKDMEKAEMTFPFWMVHATKD